MPGLDGLRGLAVLSVVGYHAAIPGTMGGFLGVDLFFVLSGFLITGLLVEERARRGRIALTAFWGRRARRLLPALLVLLIVVSAAAAGGALHGVPDLGSLRADGLATLAYVANWHQLLAGQSYFAQFAAPSPLAHTWSLAIEEQFYVLWPLLVAGLLWVGGRQRLVSKRRRGLAPLGWLAVAGAVASASWMGWLSAHGAGTDRLYYGTDTRAFELLGGAALAVAVAGRPRARPRPGRAGRAGRAARAALHAASVAGLVTMVALIAVAAGAPPGSAGPPRWMFPGGMALFCVSALAVVAEAGWLRSGPVTTMLRFAPLRFLGRISYALYLWHWPVVTQLTAARTGLGGAALVGLRLVAAGALAVVSTLLLEEPIRRRAVRVGVPSTEGRADLTSSPLVEFHPNWWNSTLSRRGHGGPPPAPGRRQTRGARPQLRTSLRGAWLTVAAVATVAACVVAGTNVAVAVAGATSASVADVSPPGAATLASEPRLQLTDMVHPSPQSPLRVTLVGDSVMSGQAPATIAALRATGAAVVTDMAYPGWGLSTDHSWPTSVPEMLAHTRPQLVVAMWSWDGNWLLADPSGYRAALEHFLTVLLDPPNGAPAAGAVVLEQFPPLGPLPVVKGGPAAAAHRVAGVKAWNQLASSMPARFPGKVLYLPLGGVVERAGRYATWLRQAPGGPWVRVRSVDATHFCPAGAARYSAALLADLRTEVPLPAPRPGWWSGRWQHAAVFGTPAGTCPADSPGSGSR